MDYKLSSDLKCIRELLVMTQDELAHAIGVEQVTVSRQELELTKPSFQLLEKVYSYAFEKKIRLNLLKEMLWKEDINSKHELLFHGAKDVITGTLGVTHGRRNNDFGQGFYAGETYEQAVSFITGFDRSSVYYLDFDNSDLKSKRYGVDRDWMMTIAYYRGFLNSYKNHPNVKRLLEDLKDVDYIVAPIADNRMFQIINSFISGEITDEQCKHCLSATNLGSQYVFLTEKAINQVKLVERCYVAKNERDYYALKRREESLIGADKVKVARIKYRGQGKYIDEILEEVGE